MGLGRLFQARHAMFYDARFNPNLDFRSGVMRLCDFVFIIPCMAHDISNAVRWSLAPLGSMSVDIHIVIESLRNTFVPVFSKVPQLMFAHTQSVDTTEEFTVVACLLAVCRRSLANG